MILPLRSEHVIGIDAHSEFWRMQLTTASQFWKPLAGELIDSSLIISILPVIYQAFMGVDPQKLFNILFSLIFSVSPLIIYILTSKYFNIYQAFIASFFFISIPAFSSTIMYARSNMAVFFFGLALISALNDRINLKSRRLIFFLLASGIIISHYSTTFIIIFLLIISFIFVRFIETFDLRFNFKLESAVLSARSILRLPLIMLFLLLSYYWYNYAIGTVFDLGFLFIKKSIISLTDFFLLESRSSEVSFIFGMSDKLTYIPTKIELISSWSTIVLIAIGVLGSLVYFSRAFRFYSKKYQIYEKQIDFDSDLFSLSLALCFMLMVSLVIPFVSTGYSLIRQYILAMVLLSMFLVAGAVVLGTMLRFNYKFLLLAVVISYFLCTSGFVYELFGHSKSMSLGSNNLEYYIYNINDEESQALVWCADYMNRKLKIFGDYPFNGWLLSETGIIINYDNNLGSNNTIGYKFLRAFNIKTLKMIDRHGEKDLKNVALKLNNGNKIYNNQGSIVFF